MCENKISCANFLFSGGRGGGLPVAPVHVRVYWGGVEKGTLTHTEAEYLTFEHTAEILFELGHRLVLWDVDSIEAGVSPGKNATGCRVNSNGELAALAWH